MATGHGRIRALASGGAAPVSCSATLSCCVLLIIFTSCYSADPAARPQKLHMYIKNGRYAARANRLKCLPNCALHPCALDVASTASHLFIHTINGLLLDHRHQTMHPRRQAVEGPGVLQRHPLTKPTHRRRPGHHSLCAAHRSLRRSSANGPHGCCSLI